MIWSPCDVVIWSPCELCDKPTDVRKLNDDLICRACAAKPTTTTRTTGIRRAVIEPEVR